MCLRRIDLTSSYWKITSTLGTALTVMALINVLLVAWLLSQLTYKGFGERQAGTAKTIAGMVADNPELYSGRNLAPNALYVPQNTREARKILQESGDKLIPASVGMVLQEIERFKDTKSHEESYMRVPAVHRKYFSPRLRVVGVAPMWSAGDEYLGVILVFPSGNEKGTLRAATFAFLGVTAAAILFLALVLGMKLFAGLSKGLTELGRTANAFGNGDTSVRLTVSKMRGWGSELMAVAETFNGMAERIEGEVRRKQQLFGEISHELGTPLTILSTHLDTVLMPDMGLSNSDKTSLLMVARAEVGRMERLVSDIIDLARIDSGEFKVELTRVEVGPLLEGLCELWSAKLADASHMTLDVAGSPVAMTDPTRLYQILHNLISNASKHIGCDGYIRLRSWVNCSATEVVCISVTDTGTGIHPDDLPYIFDRFYRSGRTKPQEPCGDGRGLGLTIIKRLVELMGGSISVESAHGHGSTFTVQIPSAQ